VNIKLFPLGVAGGFDETDRVRVELTSPVWIARIHYTLDGTEPTEKSPLYTGPFESDPPLKIRARGYWNDESTPVAELDFHRVDFRVLYEHTHFKPIHWP